MPVGPNDKSECIVCSVSPICFSVVSACGELGFGGSATKPRRGFFAAGDAGSSDLYGFVKTNGTGTQLEDLIVHFTNGADKAFDLLMESYLV